jgi:hypothetical protein
LRSNHWFSGLESLLGAFPLSIFVAGGAAALLVWVGVLAYRYAGRLGPRARRQRDVAAVGAVLLVAIIGAAIWQQGSTARQSLEERVAELRARAMTPGSPLACLDAVADATVEEACRAALFAHPETVSAALSYTDARLSLLADSVGLAARDRSFAQALEWLRLAVEADNFGLVAQVLAIRGCVAGPCDRLKLLRDPRRVLANLQSRTFETNVATYSVTWRAAEPSVPAQPSVSVPMAGAPGASGPGATAMAAAPRLATGGAARQPDSFPYPSAASIPSVSILKPEPPLPSGAAPVAAAPAPPPPPQTARSPATVTVRRPAAREQPQQGARPLLQVAPVLGEASAAAEQPAPQ